MLTLVCSIIGHRRSRRHARTDGECWRTICTRCRVPLTRVGPKTWRETAEDQAA